LRGRQAGGGNAEGGHRRERITRAFDRDLVRDAAADAGTFGRASPLPP